MNKLLLLTLVMASIPSTSLASGQTPEDELGEMEQRVARAWLQADRDTIEDILTDDWRVIDINGRVRTKADLLRDMFGPDGPGIQQMTVDDVAVRLLGDDVAIVTGRTTASGTDGSTVRLRFTDIAVRRNGRWHVTASQGTPIVE